MGYYAGLVISLLIMAAFGVTAWAIAKVIRAERRPVLEVRDGKLIVKTYEETKEYELTPIDHILVVTTQYFSASGDITRKSFFLVDKNGRRILIYARDPVSMLTGNYSEFISRLEFLARRPVKFEELVEDVDGKIMTVSEYKREGKVSLF